jgi:hypothetical protein
MRDDFGWFRCVSGCPNDKPMNFGGTQLSDKAIEDVWRANGTLEIWPICFSSHQVFVSGLGHSQPFHLFAKRVIITVVVIHVLWISAPVLNRLCQNTHEGACCNFSPSDDHLLVRSNPAQFGTEPLYFYIGTTGHVVALCSMPRHCWGMCLICFFPLRFPLRGGKSHRGEVQRFGSGTARAQAGLLYKLVS